VATIVVLVVGLFLF
jgi:molecular chaperone DnaK